MTETAPKATLGAIRPDETFTRQTLNKLGELLTVIGEAQHALDELRDRNHGCPPETEAAGEDRGPRPGRHGEIDFMIDLAIGRVCTLAVSANYLNNTH